MRALLVLCLMIAGCESVETTTAQYDKEATSDFKSAIENIPCEWSNQRNACFCGTVGNLGYIRILTWAPKEVCGR